MRSVGKTYAFKEWAIKDFLKTGAEFVYMRRMDSEIGEVKHNLFDDISHKFGKVVKCRGSVFYIRNTPPEELEGKEIREWEELNPWKKFGYAMSLNLGQYYKSGAWPKVNKICLDEFIIENNRIKYMVNEPDIFAGLILTIFRERKGRTVALSNAGAIWNPYFSAYGITSKDLQQDFIVRRGGGVVFQQYRHLANEQAMKAGMMGRIGTDNFIQYALESKFKDVDEHMIVGVDDVIVIKKHFNIIASSGKSFILLGTASGKAYIKAGKDNSINTYGLSPRDLQNRYSKDIVASIKDMIYRKKILFDSIDTRLEVMSDVNF